MGIIHALDKVGEARHRIGFVERMFTAANPRELEFSEESLCGFCQILRGVMDILDEVDQSLDGVRKNRASADSVGPAKAPAA